MSDIDPRLWPVDASADYIEARRRLLVEERRLSEHAEAVASLRRALPAGAEVPPYAFAGATVRPDGSVDQPKELVTLPEAFGDFDVLVIYHLMFPPDAERACPMCSMWVDGFAAVSPHVSERMALAVVGRSPLPRLVALAQGRGWTGLRLYSSFENSFNRDFGVEDEDGTQHPGLSVFERDGATVRHIYTAQAAFSATEQERGIDLLSPVWQIFDLTPVGRADWYASR
jgi:predicted dithiol-disulfide oxidoreductase (DUF899 family)